MYSKMHNVKLPFYNFLKYKSNEVQSLLNILVTLLHQPEGAQLSSLVDHICLHE